MRPSAAPPRPQAPRARRAGTGGLLVAVAVAMGPAPGAAQATLDRLEAVAVALGARVNAALVARIPDLAGALPDPDWDAPLRAAYTCLHDAYVAEVGAAPVAAMIARMEADLATLDDAELLETGGAVAPPAGVDEAEAARIVAECRLVEVYLARMEASGALAILAGTP